MTPTLILWASAVISFVAAGSTFRSWRRTLRSCRQMRALWVDQAPPVEPAVVILKTGDRLSVAPENVHKCWSWELRVPVGPDQVDEIELPELPPWTKVVVLPPGAPKDPLG